MNTFRWEITPAYLDWHRDMTDYIRALSPDLPVCVSNPGVGLLGHDPIHWARKIGPDFFSLHNYPDICGSRPGLDYAAVTDMAVQYVSAAVPVMLGEWEAIPLRRADVPEKEELLTLLSRDMVWLTLLSGAPGCVSWLARGYGQYRAVKEVFRELDGRPLLPDPPLYVDITEAQARLEDLWRTGEPDCRFPGWKWCPDRSATDGRHRFCVKAESPDFQKLLDAEQWSLTTGVPFRFVLGGEKHGNGRTVPLSDLTPGDFLAVPPVLAPVAGYRQKALLADGGRVCLLYLQNCGPAFSWAVDDGMGGRGEQFSLRRRKAVPVTMRLTGVWDRVRLYDLDEGRFVSDNSGALPDPGVTDHDFVLLCEKA